MWKSSEPPHRRRLQFDPLEGRQLLNGSDFSATQAGMVAVSFGSAIELAWMSGHEVGVAGWDVPASPTGAANSGFGAAIEQREIDSNAAQQRQAGLISPGSSDWSTQGGDRWSSVPSPGSSAVGTAQANPSTQPTDAAASMTSSPPSDPGASGNMTAPVGGTLSGSSPGSPASGSSPGGPGGAPPGGLQMADFLSQNRQQDQASPPSFMNFPPLSQNFFGGRDRTDGPEFGSAGTAPLGPTLGAGVNGAQTPATIVGNVGTAVVATTPAAQAPPTGGSVSAQLHSIVGDNEAPAGDRSIAVSLGSVPRGVADANRGAQASVHAILATTASHPELESPSTGPASAALPTDHAVPLPRGADLIAEALPLAGDALERSLEDFVRQLRAVDVAGIVTEGPTPVVVASLAIVGAAASAVVVGEVVRRRARRGKGVRIVDSLGRELALSFPELPRSWSEKA